MANAGKYIVLEGPDGTGKTTQANLLAEELNRRGAACHYVHEPGQTPIGNELERIIKDRSLDRSPLTDLLLFTANRVEVYNQVIAPALESGAAVVADRNWLSSVAYQGVASGLGADTVRDITAQHLPETYTEPTFTVLLRTSDSHREKLLGARGTSDKDYFETQPESFQQALHRGYEDAAAMANPNKSAFVSAEGTIEEVYARIIEKLEAEKII
jgi:dTMP kinase